MCSLVPHATWGQDLDELWQLVHAGHAGIAERVERAARALVGTTYQESPLGEGHGVDSDPRLRLDAFDCTTLVETVAALALAPSPAEVAAQLDVVRYDGQPVHFDHRLHLPTAQWLPALQRRGTLVESTEALFALNEAFRPSAVRLVVTAADLARASRDYRAGRGLPELPYQHLPRGVFELPVVRTQDVGEMSSAFPTSGVLQVVRAPRAGRPWMVTHQALLVRALDGQAPGVIHASTVKQRVVEVSLASFLAGQTRARRWPVAGFNVQRWGEESSTSSTEARR